MCGWKAEINNLISVLSTHIKTSSYKLVMLMMIFLYVKYSSLFLCNNICTKERMREKWGLTHVVNICRKISMVDNDRKLFHFCENASDQFVQQQKLINFNPNGVG